MTSVQLSVTFAIVKTTLERSVGRMAGPACTLGSPPKSSAWPSIIFMLGSRCLVCLTRLFDAAVLGGHGVTPTHCSRFQIGEMRLHEHTLPWAGVADQSTPHTIVRHYRCYSATLPLAADTGLSIGEL